MAPAVTGVAPRPPAAPQGVAVATVGCRLNQAETDELLEELSRRGVALTSEQAGLAVVNTCTVTREATATSRKVIRRTVERHPDAQVVVTGCLATAEPAAVAAVGGVDLVVANEDKPRLAELVTAETEPAAGRDPLILGEAADATGAADTPPRTRLHTRLSVRAQTGCDQHCAFCIVPQTRGGLRSRPAAAIIDTIRRRVREGVREVVLTGVHLGKYGAELGDHDGLAALVERIVTEVGALERLRLSSVLPLQVTPRLVDVMASSPRVCRHLHVPLQSGSDRVLAAMGRGYDTASFLARVGAAQLAMPGLGLSTDLIVGFPGETAADHAATMALVAGVGFSKLHVFRYSPRPGTRAAALADDVPPQVKRDRSAALITLGERCRDRFHLSLLGTELEAVVEIDRGDGWLQATADNYVKATFRGPADLLEGRVRVRVEGLRGAGVQATLMATDTG